MPIKGDINWTEEDKKEYERKHTENPGTEEVENSQTNAEEKRLDIGWAKRQARNSIGYEDLGMVITPESEEEVNEYAETYEKQGEAVGAYFRTESPLTNWAYAGVRKAKHWIEGIFAEEDTEPFDLETQMEEDGISEFDRELYDGVTSLREYEYIKEGVEREREDEHLLNEDDGIFRAVPEILEFAMFPMGGKAAGAIGSSVKISKGMTLTDGINTILSPLSSEVLKDIVKASGVGAALGGAEYAARYDISGREAIARAGVYALVGGAFSGVMHGGKAVIKKISDEVMERASVTDGKKLILDEMKRDWENELSSSGIGDKAVEGLASKSLLSKSHPYMMLFSKNEKVNRMAKELFVLNDEWVPGSRIESMEGRIDFANGKDAQDFTKSLGTLNKINKEVKGYDGTTSREWFARAFYGGEEALPVDLPHREKIIGIVNKLEKKVEEITKLREEVRGETLDLEESFLPYEETGGRFSINKVVERQRGGVKGSKPRYLPRTWDRNAIVKHEDELRELLKQGLINEKATELGDKVSVEELEKYAASPELQRAVNRQIHHLTSTKSVANGKSSPERRTIRVDDRALYRYFSKDPLSEIYNFLRKERSKLEFEKTVKEAGYKDWGEFKEKVMEDFEEKEINLRGEEKDRLLKEMERTEKLLDQTEEIMRGRFEPTEELTGNAKLFMDSATNCMYSALLGATFLNSLSDIKGMVIRCGLGDVVKNLSGSLVSAIDNGMREILKLPKSEQREILDALCLGIEETKLNARLKLRPTQNDGIFYGATEATFGEKSVYWTGKLADSVYIISGARWWEDTLRRTAAKIVLNDLKKDPKYAAKIADMIKNKEFSEEIEEIVYSKVNKMVNRPKMADVPAYAYTPFGKLFYSLQSWSFANSSNYLYPLLKGKFKKGRIAESILTVVMAEMVNKYVRRLSQGNPYDLSDEEDMIQFEKDVLNQSLDTMAGTVGIHQSAIMAGVRGVRRGDTGKLIHDMVPLMGYGDYIASLIGNGLKLYNGTLTYKQARKGLRAVPYNNVWWIEGGVNALAEGISEER